jgi:hypothetical protein
MTARVLGDDILIVGSVCFGGHALRGLAVLMFELRALHLLGRKSTTWATSSDLFCFCYFSDSLPLLPRAGLGLRSSYLGLLCTWDYRHVPPWLTYFWDRVSLIFPLLSLNHNPPISTLYIVRIIIMYHHVWLNSVFLIYGITSSILLPSLFTTWCPELIRHPNILFSTHFCNHFYNICGTKWFSKIYHAVKILSPNANLSFF